MILVILAWSMIVIVYWTIEDNFVYFAQKRWLICEFSGRIHWLIVLVSWAVENNLVYF